MERLAMLKHAACLLIGTVTCIGDQCKLSADENWPQFRGPGGRGVSQNEDLPLAWSDSENVEWKVDVPGRGWSSPVVWGDRVFLTTVEREGEFEEAKKGLYFGGERLTPSEDTHHWRVLCLDLESGDIVWSKEVHAGPPQTSIHIKNSYASETPVTDGERVYAYFGNLGLFCLDFDGEIIWTREFERVPIRFGWGLAASPALFGDHLYLVNDNDGDSYLLKLDKLTGDTVWKVDREEHSNWSTPFVWKNDLRTEIVTPGTDLVRSYSLDRELLWNLKGMSVITIATPYEYDGNVIISSGYVLDPNKPVYAVRPGASGDISLGEEETSNDWVAWCSKKAAPYNPSTLVYQDHLFVLYDRGIYATFDAKTGEEADQRRRIPKGRQYTSSPWAYRGHVFCINEDGMTTVFDADNNFDVVGTNPLSDDDMCLATPALAGDRLLIRTAGRLYCIRQ